MAMTTGRSATIAIASAGTAATMSNLLIQRVLSDMLSLREGFSGRASVANPAASALYIERRGACEGPHFFFGRTQRARCPKKPPQRCHWRFSGDGRLASWRVGRFEGLPGNEEDRMMHPE